MSHPSAHNSAPFLIPSDLNPGRREHCATSQMTKTAATDAIRLVLKLPFETDPERCRLRLFLQSRMSPQTSKPQTTWPESHKPETFNDYCHQRITNFSFSALPPPPPKKPLGGFLRLLLPLPWSPYFAASSCCWNLVFCSEGTRAFCSRM